MKSFVIVCLALSAAKEVYSIRLDDNPVAYKDSIPLFELQRNTQHQKYKDVILYLKPSELKSLKENNVLEVLNNQLYAKKLENTQLSTLLTQQPHTLKPVQELNEDIPTPDNYKLVNIPLFYPFDLIPLNNGKELEERSQDKKLTEDMRKQIEESLRKPFENQNTWTDVAGKQNKQQNNPLSPKVPEVTPDYLLQLHQILNNYDIRNTLSVQAYYRLQYELEQLIKNSNYGNISQRMMLLMRTMKH